MVSEVECKERERHTWAPKETREKKRKEKEAESVGE